MYYFETFLLKCWLNQGLENWSRNEFTSTTFSVCLKFTVENFNLKCNCLFGYYAFFNELEPLNFLKCSSLLYKSCIAKNH